MVESWYQYMNVGTLHFMSFPEAGKGEGPIAETLETILRDDFFTAVEVTRIKDDQVREVVTKMLEASHVVTSFAMHPVILSNKLDINSLVEEERKKAVDAVKRGIEEAAYLGATGVSVLSGPHPGTGLEQEGVQRLLESLDELCDYSGRHRMTFELETFDVDVEKRCLIGRSDLAATVAKKVRAKHPNFGLILDLSHIPLQGEPTKTAVMNCAPYTTHLHIGNCVLKDTSHRAYGDQHPRFGVKGGENDVEQLREFFEALFAAGVLKRDAAVEAADRPLISFEVKPMAGENPVLVLANSKRVFKQAWALL
ncbi:MAG: sugar phosphate isomerase/epimerase [Deltaproteobacteria bacterium]|nr:sugar phosphate isomerase/epimerase [Deltaproteobacteria bacterium]